MLGARSAWLSVTPLGWWSEASRPVWPFFCLLVSPRAFLFTVSSVLVPSIGRISFLPCLVARRVLLSFSARTVLVPT